MRLLNRMMKTLKRECGQALPMALIMMVVGGLLVVPMVTLMTTHLTSNRVVEQENFGIYAADAGIQDVLWKLGNGVEPFSDESSYYVLPETVNGMTVTVEELEMDVGPDGYLYTIRSTASRDSENVTSILAQACAGASFHWLFENVLTSAHDVELGSNCTLYGDIVCGGVCTGDTDGVSGDIYEGSTVIMPTEELLTAFYLSTFDDEVRANPANYHPDNPYTSATYTVPPGYTYANPYEIPWLYCTADKLTIEASSDTYAKLTGNIFLTGSNNNGKFELSDKDVTLDLNNYTIYATYSDYPDCANNPASIYFGPGTYVNGPGCIIGVGNVDFQPSASQGDRLLGTGTYTEGTTTELQDKFVLSRFYCKDEPTGEISSIQVKCYFDDPDPPPAHLKVAIYADSDGNPGSLLNEAESDNITVSSWKPVDFPSTELQKKTWYWLAAIADADIICTQTNAEIDSRSRDEDFDGFQFPDPATQNPLTNVDGTEYMLRGFTGSQQFFFLMSVECTVNVQPRGSFYGSIAGNANVHLQPDCFVNLVNTPEGGLNFPGSGSSGNAGDAPPLLNYNIQ